MAADSIAWALDLLALHNIPPLAEDEDERRLIGELIALGWDPSWTEEPLPRTTDTPYTRCLRSAETTHPGNREAYLVHCEQLKTDADRDQYEVTGKAQWLPVGEVRIVQRGETLQEAALFALALALELQGARG